MKKIVSLILVLSLIVGMFVGLSTNALATDNDGGLTITTTINNTLYTFSDSNCTVHNPLTETDYYSYSKYCNLPSGTNLSCVDLSFDYNGTALKINGTQVDTNNNGHAIFEDEEEAIVDFSSSIVTVEVVYSGGTRLYYVSAYTGSFNVTVVLDYSNASYFSTRQANTSYTQTGCNHCPQLNLISSTQLSTASTAVSSMDTAFTNQTKTGTYYVSGGTSAISALNTFATDKSITVSGSSQNVTGIGALNENSTASFNYTYTYGNHTYTYTYGAGGWMYKVSRGGANAVFPMIGGGNFVLMPGDVVTWIYTCDLGYDVHCEMSM